MRSDGSFKLGQRPRPLTSIFLLSIAIMLASSGRLQAYADENSSESNAVDPAKKDLPSTPPALQGYAKRDSKGTPVVPEWKMQAGYDELFGKFYIGFVGIKLIAVNGPPSAAVLGKAQLKHWHGRKPFPCLLKFTKLQDDSGGYYFQTVGCEDGPKGWIIPQPSVPHETKTWAIYFMQEKDESKVEGQDKIIQSTTPKDE